MRELKFRMWDEKKNTVTKPMLLEDMVLKASTKNPETFHWNCDIPIMQFTGLKDKNGKEIYEGDIIKATAKEIQSVIDKVGNSFAVKYKDASFSVEATKVKGAWIYLHDIEECEIIGNIHENPELIK